MRKMGKLKILIIHFTMLTLLSACEDCGAYMDSEYDFPFFNGSDDTIYTCITNCYPDTLPNTDFFHINYHYPKVVPDGVYTQKDRDPKKSNDMFCLFIIAKDTMEKYDFNTIRIGYKILQRYDLSGKNFARYKISYPPTEEMKDIKMYPPYSNVQ